MIISRTPFRISFFGGGTDYPAWFREHGGAVLATTIDKYCYLTCRYLPPFFEHRMRIVYSKIENCRTIDEIGHPAVREILKYLRIERGLEIHCDNDLPARSGMGSSSSFTVGLLHALYALLGQMPSKHQLAREGIYVEQTLLQETVGCQDQVLAAHGGLRQVIFHADGEISVVPLTIARERIHDLNSHLMLFFTGIARTSSDIARTYVTDLQSKRRQMRLMRDLVDEGTEILAGERDLSAFGELLHEAWTAKRSLGAHVSNPQVDALYDAARAAGALGGKLTGAGGGGFLLLFVPPDRQQTVKDKLQGLVHVPFQFESAGTQIIFYEAGEDYAALEAERAGRSIAAFREMPIPRAA
ncbi:MAG: kinase [Planctomycetaceae bacterium]|nr:kinase [Planctomycetaceae bacterium]